MSHSHERKEKDCLNCGAVVYGRYCHICGQENVVPKETFMHLVAHFFFDITHFDGKFFSTVKFLLSRPGFLSAEYVKGRRLSYLNPIKMYVFTSAIFFLFFYSVVKPEQAVKINNEATVADILNKINSRKTDLASGSAELGRSTISQQFFNEQLAGLNADIERLKTDTTNLEELNYYKFQGFSLSSQPHYNLAQYDSQQAKLPESERDGWLEHQYRKKKLGAADRSGDAKSFTKLLVEKFFHSFPQIMFVSLPLFALLLQALYARRKRFYYADHIIYTVHLYCAVFILIFFAMVARRTEHVSYIGWLSYLTVPICLYLAWYIYKSIRNFYSQGRLKTILKYILLIVSASLMMSLLFAAFSILSLFTV